MYTIKRTIIYDVKILTDLMQSENFQRSISYLRKIVLSNSPAIIHSPKAGIQKEVFKQVGKLLTLVLCWLALRHYSDVFTCTPWCILLLPVVHSSSSPYLIHDTSAGVEKNGPVICLVRLCHGSTGSPSALSEEDSKGGVTVLEGSKVLARGTRSCT